MKFLLLLYGDERRYEGLSPEAIAESFEIWNAFGRELTESGAYIAAEALEPTGTASTVRIEDDEVVRTDGPFAETREQLGGFYLIECQDIDEAAAWAAKVPDLPGGGSVEVRPVADYSAYGEDQPTAADTSQA